MKNYVISTSDETAINIMSDDSDLIVKGPMSKDEAVQWWSQYGIPNLKKEYRTGHNVEGPRYVLKDGDKYYIAY